MEERERLIDDLFIKIDQAMSQGNVELTLELLEEAAKIEESELPCT
jgi:hypothetical protein